MVHRADAELAVGRDVVLDARLAADGIDEWLAMATGFRQRGDGSAALPAGATLHLSATGSEPADWLSAARLMVLPCTAVLPAGTAPATPMSACRVRPSGSCSYWCAGCLPDDPAIAVTGDGALLSGWLAGTPF